MQLNAAGSSGPALAQTPTKHVFKSSRQMQEG